MGAGKEWPARMVAAAAMAAGAPLALPGASLTALQLALLHVAAYTVLFTAADAFLGWRRSRGQATLSPKPPSRAAVGRERLRTLCSALVDAAYYWLILRHGSFHRVPDTAAGLGQLMLFGAGLFLFADAHFYVTHRLLHWGPLYRHVHYVHHQSVNPGAWSSLSFHPIEAAIFFSVHLPMLLLPTPRDLFLIYKVGLVVGPLHAHCGVDLGPMLHSSVDHYLHHRYKRGNFGGYLPLDRLCGTGLRRDGTLCCEAPAAEGHR